MRNRYLTIFLVLGLAGCVALAPGVDPLVVRTEQTLAGADAFYKTTMEWYFTPGVAADLGRDAIVALETLRTGYDRPYRGLQAALTVYKAIKAQGGDTAAAQASLRAAEGKLAAILTPAQGVAPTVVTK